MYGIAHTSVHCLQEMAFSAYAKQNVRKKTAFTYTEQDVIQLYKDAVLNNRDELVSLLRIEAGGWQVALVDTGSITQDEWGNIEASCGSGREKRTNRANAILDLILEKNHFACYNGFSRVVVKKERHIGEKIFQFVKELETAGLHEPLCKGNTQVLIQHAISTELSEPVIVWILSSEIEFSIMKKLMKSKGSHSYEQMGFSCQVYTCQ